MNADRGYRLRSRVGRFASVVAGAAVLVLVGLFARAWAGGHRGLLAGAGVGVLLYASALFWPASARIRLALMTLAAVFALYAAEIALTLVGGAPPAAGEARAQPTGAVPDRRTKLQVVEDLRAAGVDAWPSAHPSVVLGSDGVPTDGGRILPLGGISRVRTVYCNEGAGYMIFDSDENGFNNPPGLHHPGVIALIGDSFTEGACMRPGQDVGGRLRAAGFHALNLGNGGDGPLLELATLAEYARPLRPAVVVWLYYEGNDFWDLDVEKLSPTLLRYLDGDFSAGLLSKQDEIDGALKAFAQREETRVQEGQRSIVTTISDLVKLSALRSRFHLVRYPGPSPLFRRTIERAKTMVAGWGGRLYFVYLPQYARYVDRPKRVDRSFHSYAEVLALADELGLPVIDFQDVVAREPDPLAVFTGHGHCTAYGYALLGATIAARLRQDHVPE